MIVTECGLPTLFVNHSMPALDDSRVSYTLCTQHAAPAGRPAQAYIIIYSMYVYQWRVVCMCNTRQSRRLRPGANKIPRHGGLFVNYSDFMVSSGSMPLQVVVCVSLAEIKKKLDTCFCCLRFMIRYSINQGKKVIKHQIVLVVSLVCLC